MFCELMIDPDQRTASKEMLLIMKASKKLSMSSVNASTRAHYHYCSCLIYSHVGQVCACLRLCVCVNARFTFLIPPTPPMTAHQLCRYSDSAGAPLVWLLKIKSNWAQMKQLVTNPSSQSPTAPHDSCLAYYTGWHISADTHFPVFYEPAHRPKSLPSLIRHNRKLLMLPIIYHVSFYLYSWVCRGDLIKAEDLSKGCIVCLIGSVKRWSISKL